MVWYLIAASQTLLKAKKVPNKASCVVLLHVPSAKRNRTPWAGVAPYFIALYFMRVPSSLPKSWSPLSASHHRLFFGLFAATTSCGFNLAIVPPPRSWLSFSPPFGIQAAFNCCSHWKMYVGLYGRPETIGCRWKNHPQSSVLRSR